MTYVSPEIERMAERCKLPITCYWQDDFWELEWPGNPESAYCNGLISRTAAGATGAYLHLVHEIQSRQSLALTPALPASRASSRRDNCGGCSGGSGVAS